MRKENFTGKRGSLLIALAILFGVFSSFMVVGEGDLSKGISIELVKDEIQSIAEPVGEVVHEGNTAKDLLSDAQKDITNEQESEKDFYIDIEKIQETVIEAGKEGYAMGLSEEDEPATKDNEKESQNLTDEKSTLDGIYIDLDEVLNKTKILENISIIKVNFTGELFGEENSAPNDEEVQASRGSSNSGKSYSYIELEEIQKNDSENNLENENLTNTSFEEPSLEDKKEITQVYYKGNKKEIETKFTQGEEIRIYKDEIVEEKEDEWKKEVKVYSDAHFENELRVYADILESEGDKIKIYWQEEDKYLDFETYDKNSNGLIERISWIVPHLSNQTFDIIINFNDEEILNASEILIEPVNLPNSITNGSEINFEFNLSYNNMSNLECHFWLNGSGTNTSHIESESFNYSLALGNGSYSWNLNCYDKEEISINKTNSGNFAVAIDYSPKIEFSLSDGDISEGESVNFYFNVSIASSSLIYYTIEFGDGQDYFGLPLTTNAINVALTHNYETAGDYNVNLSIHINDASYQELRIIKVKSISDEDNEGPQITLIKPENNEKKYLESKSEAIIFSYNASDNTRLSNCTFNLYYYNNSVFASLIYSELKNVASGQTSIDLTDFEEGQYLWEIECYDNSSNYASKEREFSVLINSINSTPILLSAQTNGNAKEVERIQNLIDSINDFFIEEEKYNPEEKEVANDLQILDDLKFYKKKLLQMKLDVEHNIDYIKGSERRETRLEEIMNEVEEYEKKVPKEIKVIGDYEYQKNSLEFDVEEVINSYIESKGIVLDRKKVKGMIKQNELISNFIISSASIKHVEIEYNSSLEKITLITKKIQIKNESFDSLMEIVSEEVAGESEELIFVNEYTTIKENSIFEIKKEDLIKGNLVYYVKKIVDFEDIEKTNTMPFVEESAAENFNPLTGFVSFSGIDAKKSIWVFISWSLALSIIYFIFSSGYRNFKFRSGTKGREIEKVLDLISHSKEFLERKDIEKAKENYRKISEEYSSLSEDCKKFIYKKIEKLRIDIDKKDIASLIKEFSSAMKEGRKEDALLIYKDINKIYPSMPKKYKKKVYTKVLPYVND